MVGYKTVDYITVIIDGIEISIENDGFFFPVPPIKENDKEDRKRIIPGEDQPEKKAPDRNPHLPYTPTPEPPRPELHHYYMTDLTSRLYER